MVRVGWSREVPIFVLANTGTCRHACKTCKSLYLMSQEPPPPSRAHPILPGVAVDAEGKIYVSDKNRVRLVSGGTVSCSPACKRSFKL
jgi:hypothetical protein